jgi:arginase
MDTTWPRPITIIGAPSSIGIKPYADGTVRRLDLAPAILRQQGLAARLGARDGGDVVPPPYRDFERTPGKVRNEDLVERYSRDLAQHVAASDDGSFLLVLGGDCSVVLGCLSGMRRKRARIGLVYVDAHGDFATPALSHTGSAASMCLALAVGHGDSVLARLDGDTPLTRPEDLVLIGRRDDADASGYDEEALRAGGVLDLPQATIRDRGIADVALLALERVTQTDIDGFWIHVDADVIDPGEVPAVDSPEPNGLALEELSELLTPLVRHPGAIGLELTIYDPALDPDRTSAARLANLLERAIGRRGGNRP